MREADIHPCFACTLPDCDDTNTACALRRALAAADRLRRRGDTVPAILNRQASIAYREIYYPARQQRRVEARAR